MVPVCSPTLLPAGGIREPLDLAQLVLLQTSSRLEAWHDWFQAQDCYTEHSYHGPRFETFSMALRAAEAGCGVALVPEFLAVEELQAGQLVVAWPFSQNGAHAYYLAYPEHKGEVPKIKAFVTWISEQTGVDSASNRGRIKTPVQTDCTVR